MSRIEQHPCETILILLLFASIFLVLRPEYYSEQDHETFDLLAATSEPIAHHRNGGHHCHASIDHRNGGHHCHSSIDQHSSFCRLRKSFPHLAVITTSEREGRRKADFGSNFGQWLDRRRASSRIRCQSGYVRIFGPALR
jgi:hypothetical protein